MNTSLEELKKEVRERRQELKNWLYGTVWKQYDTEETALTVMDDVDKYLSDSWLDDFSAKLYRAGQSSGRNEAVDYIESGIDKAYMKVDEFRYVRHNDGLQKLLQAARTVEKE